MKLWMWQEKHEAEQGTVRWRIEWETVKPGHDEISDIDPGRDLDWHVRSYQTERTAKIQARRLLKSGTLAYGVVRLEKQIADSPEENPYGQGEWITVGETQYVEG